MGAEMVAAAAGEGIITSALNVWQADANRDFQREMSNTAIQRQVKDMRAAGINPILAARYGGASTPAGANASATSARVAQTALESDVARADIAAKMATAENQSSAAGVNRATERQINSQYEAQLQRVWAELEAVKTSTSKNAVERDLAEKQQLMVEAQIKAINQSTANSALEQHRLKAESKYFDQYGSSAVARERAGWMGGAIDILRKGFRDPDKHKGGD